MSLGSVLSRFATPGHRLSAWMRFACAALLSVTLISAAQPAASADDAAVEFIKRMSRELIAANKAGSAQAFADAINRNAHVNAIGSYALGTYQGALKPTDKDGYFFGMVRFISRYAASESAKYQVSHLEVLGPASRTKSGVVVDTKIHLRDGSAYDVQWLLQSSGTGYKIRDAKVQVIMGDYWMTPFLKDLFEKYISENGSVTALVLALNR